MCCSESFRGIHFPFIFSRGLGWVCFALLCWVKRGVPCLQNRRDMEGWGWFHISGYSCVAMTVEDGVHLFFRVKS